MDIKNLLGHGYKFFASITIELDIFLSLPATSYTVEKSFSTLTESRTCASVALRQAKTD